MAELNEALSRFANWFETAKADDRIAEPNAMSLATARTNGMPAVRTVLLKGFDERGFVFYTNTQSRKGQQLAANPQAAVVFHWAILARQILIEGKVATVDEEEADAYFASRPRLSQLGAWASAQSEVLPDRSAFDSRLAHYESVYKGREVERPPHWTGYRITPEMIEFWQGREGRLHERERYTLTDNGQWHWSLIYP